MYSINTVKFFEFFFTSILLTILLSASLYTNLKIFFLKGLFVQSLGKLLDLVITLAENNLPIMIENKLD